MADQDVDEFGRAVNASREKQNENEARPPIRERERTASEGVVEKEATVPHAGRESAPHPRRDYVSRGGGRSYGGRDRGFSGGRDSGPPHYPPRHNNHQGGRGHFDHSRQGQRAQPAHGVQPLKTFKSFVLEQRDEAAPEVYKKRYDEYQTQHLNSFVEGFFHANKADEWFRERFDPLKRQELRQEATAWAVMESAEFAKALKEDPEKLITSCTLEPSANKPKGEGGLSLTGKHLSGHAENTLCLTGIPASCSKASLRAAITEVVPVFLRLLLAEPKWTEEKEKDKDSSIVFHRTAWLVMPSAAAAQDAFGLLSNIRLKVLGPVDVKTGMSSPLYAFSPKVSVHAPFGQLRTPFAESMSTLARISFDLQRATELGALLDELRDIPRTQTLATLLENHADDENFKAALTYKLDVALAYLRRVHLVSYYTAQRFLDEAHLLAAAPEIVHRKTGFIPPISDESTAEALAIAVDPIEADKRFDELLRVARDELERKLASKEEGYVPSEDERDAAILAEKNDEILTEWMAEYIKHEPDGKGRCGLDWCKKLFKGTDFLLKHLKSKHGPDFTGAKMLAAAEPFMKTRFNKEDYELRLLPPVQIETTFGLELVPVKAVFDRIKNPEPTARLHGRGDFERRPRPQQDPQREKRRQSDPNRPLVKYSDLDTPKVTTVSLDYGVAVLPPPKRRKLLAKSQQPPALESSEGAAAGGTELSAEVADYEGADD